MCPRAFAMRLMLRAGCYSDTLHMTFDMTYYIHLKR